MSETQESWVQSPGREDPLERDMATHCSILAWRATVHGVTKSWTGPSKCTHTLVQNKVPGSHLTPSPLFHGLSSTSVSHWSEPYQEALLPNNFHWIPSSLLRLNSSKWLGQSISSSALTQCHPTWYVQGNLRWMLPCSSPQPLAWASPH